MWFLVILNLTTFDSVEVGSFTAQSECMKLKTYVEQSTSKPMSVTCSYVEDYYKS